MIAFAPSNRRSRWRSTNAGWPARTRSPSQTPSPRTKPASKTETTARSRGTSSPLTQTRMRSLRGSSSKSCVPWATGPNPMDRYRPRHARRRRHRDRDRPSARGGRGLRGRSRQRDRLVQEHHVGHTGDRGARDHRVAHAVLRPVPRADARLPLRGARQRPRAALRHEHIGGPVPDGDDLHVGGRGPRRDAHGAAQPRRAIRLLQALGPADDARDAARQRGRPAPAEGVARGGLGARARADEAALERELGELHGVERRALEQVVADHEEVEDLRVVEIGSHAADDRLVAARPLQRRRRLLDDEVRERAQHLQRLVEARLALERGADGDRVPDHHRHAHAQRRDGQLRERKDLARLVLELHLLVGVALLVERPEHRHHVEGQRVGVDAVFHFSRGALAVVDELLHVRGERRHLRGQLVDALLPRAAGGLEARAHHALQPERRVKRLGRQHHDHRRAVRVGDDALARVGDRVRVDLADDERDLGIHAPRARVVDHERAVGGKPRRPLARRPAAGAEQREVEAGDRVVTQGLDDAPVELAARRALGREEHDVVRGERAPLEQAAHDAAHGSGGTDDREPHDENCPKGCSGRIVSNPDSSKAECSARTASGTRSPRMTQEMRMGDVEIISMLMSLEPRVVKTLAATPGCVFIPAPTIETLPIASSLSTSPRPSAWSVIVAVCRSSRGTVNDISAREPSDFGSFCTIMSTLTLASASALAIRPATPGVSGTPTSVTRASPVEWVTAVIEGCSTVTSSPTTTVPGASSKLERQWMRTPWLRAYSTERSWSTPAPLEAISSISSKETIGSLRASGTIRGSALKTPGTSV